MNVETVVPPQPEPEVHITLTRIEAADLYSFLNASGGLPKTMANLRMALIQNEKRSSFN